VIGAAPRGLQLALETTMYRKSGSVTMSLGSTQKSLRAGGRVRTRIHKVGAGRARLSPLDAQLLGEDNRMRSYFSRKTGPPNLRFAARSSRPRIRLRLSATRRSCRSTVF
jgi:hypothetical protein